jgi:hypothetical protein
MDAIEDVTGGGAAPHTLRGATHTDVATAPAPTNGQVLAWNGTKWSPTTVASTSGSYLPLSGGTLTGALTLAADPSANYHAATKKYVDDKVAAGSGSVGQTGQICSITINAAGATAVYSTTYPTVTITGGGGSGATAVINASCFSPGNQPCTWYPASLQITNPGSGYTSAPTVTIGGGPFKNNDTNATIAVTATATLCGSSGGSGAYVGSTYINVTGNTISLNTSTTNGTGLLYAAKTHTHTEYSPTTHTHSTYALTSHNHDSTYASIGHTHSTYLTQAVADGRYALIGYIPSATSNVAVLTGSTSGSSGTLPLPVGFTEAQCKFLYWAVAATDPLANNDLIVGNTRTFTVSGGGVTIAYIVIGVK